MSVKKILLLFLLLISTLYYNVCFADEQIKAQNNAYRHNNKGLLYLEEKYYYGAIKEFQIAIDLNPNSQAAAVYYVNLGTTYEKIGYFDLAKPCFEKAVRLNILCFDYYLKMVENYKKLGLVSTKLDEYKNNKSSPLNEIVTGLLYIQNGNITTGITVLDEFCNKEPNLLITTGVKEYIKSLTED